MTTRFNDCLKFILAREGGFVDNPHDRGGRTNKGITQRTFDAWLAGLKAPPQDVKVISDFQVNTIYFDDYWGPAKCWLLPAPLDLCMLDAAVNHGVGRATKMLQTVLEVEADGKVGAKTLNALHNAVANRPKEHLVKSFIAARSEFYDEIVANDETQRRFLAGWRNRLNELEKEVTR